MHHAETWGQLSEKSKQALESAYYGSLRRAVKCHRRKDTVSDAEVLPTCQRAPLGRLLAYMRLKYLVRLLRYAP
eukprot:5107913-Pyramimonas_sp.AAC.1